MDARTSAMARAVARQLLAAARSFDVTDAQWHRVVRFHGLTCPNDLSTLNAEESR